MSYQLGATKALCDLVGVSLGYVKPHGALYNQAAADAELADIIVSEIKRFDPSLKVMGLSGGQLVEAAKRHGMDAISEVFADRNYEKDGSLVSRTKDNALITDTDAAVRHGQHLSAWGWRACHCVRQRNQKATPREGHQYHRASDCLMDSPA